MLSRYSSRRSPDTLSESPGLRKTRSSPSAHRGRCRADIDPFSGHFRPCHKLSASRPRIVERAQAVGLQSVESPGASRPDRRSRSKMRRNEVLRLESFECGVYQRSAATCAAMPHSDFFQDRATIVRPLEAVTIASNTACSKVPWTRHAFVAYIVVFMPGSSSRELSASVPVSLNPGCSCSFVPSDPWMSVSVRGGSDPWMSVSVRGGSDPWISVSVGGESDPWISVSVRGETDPWISVSVGGESRSWMSVSVRG